MKYTITELKETLKQQPFNPTYSVESVIEMLDSIKYNTEGLAEDIIDSIGNDLKSCLENGDGTDYVSLDLANGNEIEISIDYQAVRDCIEKSEIQTLIDRVFVS